VRNPKVLLIVAGVLVAIVVGFIFARAPQPEVSIAAEGIFSIGGFQVTNTILTAYIVTVLLVILTFLATRKASLVPTGFYNFVEAITEWLLNFVEELAGVKNGRKFFPVVATIFLFVISANYFGLLPIVNSIGVFHQQEHGAVFHKQGPVWDLPFGGVQQVKEGETAPAETDTTKTGVIRPYLRSTNSDANSPLAIAIWAFIFVEFWGISTLGIGYFGKFLAFRPFNKHAGGPIAIFVGVLETLSEFIRMISFTFRLFGNIFAGDIVILFMSFLAPFVIPVVFYGLETFVGFIQAVVFALLTLVFAVMAVEAHDEGAEALDTASGHHAEAATH